MFEQRLFVNSKSEEPIQRLEGQSAIVTGAGRAIGRAIALALAIDTPGQRRLMGTFMPEEKFPPMTSAEAVAAAALYLLCDAPKAMNGQSLDLFKIAG